VPAPLVPAAAAMTVPAQSIAQRPVRTIVAFLKVIRVKRYPWRRRPPKRPTKRA
jgi:hypothetical protein